MLRVILAVVALTAIFMPLDAQAGAEPSTNAPDEISLITWPVDAYYMIRIRCYTRGVLCTDAEVGVINGAWAEVSTTRDQAVSPATFLAFRAGEGSGAAFDFGSIPAELLPNFKHFAAGDLEFWVYAPGWDMLEAVWMKSDLDTKPLLPSVDPKSLVDEPPYPQRIVFLPAGSMTVYL